MTGETPIPRENMSAHATPRLSIILPTYNRARFLHDALQSIRSQTFTDWELIVVDDGSTDDSVSIIPKLLVDIPQPSQVIRQENQGAYGARNTGLGHAHGEFVAFYDSDDVWLPHHLQDCVQALDTHHDLGWVYGASRIVQADTHTVLSENCFYEQGKPRAFLNLPKEVRGPLHILESKGLFEAVLRGAGLYAGLQNSVIRRSFFHNLRFDVSFYNEAEDQLVVLRAIKWGVRFGYFDKVHVIYHVHDANSSGAAEGMAYAKRVRLTEGLIRGFEGLPQSMEMAPSESKALSAKLAHLYFWTLGYGTHWQAQHYGAAMKNYVKGLQMRPHDLRMWKSFAGMVLRSLSVVCKSNKATHDVS